MNFLAKMPVLGQDQDIAFSFWAKDIPESHLLVTAFAVDEAIFGMTKIEVMLTSSDPAVDLRSMIDNEATLSIHHKYLDQLRHFSGIVVEAERGDTGHHRTAYRVVLLPSLARLDHGSDCRIFQGTSVPDIVRTIFSEHEIQDVKWQLQNDHQVREYATAYRETHLAFVERILAEEGIFYYYEHDKEGRHTLVLSDMPETLPDCPGSSELEYNATASTMLKGVYCSSLSYREKLRSTTFVQRDYSFKNPNHNQEQKDSTSNRTGEKRNYEMYDYPGRYKQDAAGKLFTKYKLEATRVDAAIAYGVANTPLLITGHGFKLQEHPDKELNQKWRLLTIRHEGVQPQAFSEDAQGGSLGTTGLIAPGINGTTLAGLAFGTTGSLSPGLLNSALNRGIGLGLHKGKGASDATLYACAFSAQPSRLPYRPPQMAKPLVDGPQVAIVVGPEGEQIYTDEHGRVKVHFPWDRHKDPKAADSSCWIRVSQPWGGGNWGNMSIPRIGHEVIVEFLEGDPDQPIIMGRTYHANNHTPYKLPAHKTKMAIRSDSHKGDGGFNELSFEDEKGQENMFMHAEKDQTIKVKNNQTQRVDANVMQAIGANQAIEVGNNVHHQVGGGVNMIVGAVGSVATSMMAGSLAPLMGIASSLIGAGSQSATEAIQGAQADTQSAIGQASDAAGAVVAAGSELAGTMNSALSDPSALAAQMGSLAGSIAMGGSLSQLYDNGEAFDKSRDGVNNAKRFDMREAGGKSMLDAGAEQGAVAAKLAEPGNMSQYIMRNFSNIIGLCQTNVVGSIRSDVTGHAHFEDIGHTHNVHIGKQQAVRVDETQDISVGTSHSLSVGDDIVILVGSGPKSGAIAGDAIKAYIRLNSSGDIEIVGKKNITISADENVQIHGKNVFINAEEHIVEQAKEIHMNDAVDSTA